MLAVLQDAPGDESTLYVGEVEVPEPKEDEVLIRVCTSALNQMDLLQCRGLYPVPAGASKIIGVEVAGYISKLGPNCTGKFKVGDRCMALLQGGGYAQYALSYECMTMHAPVGLGMEVLAAIPEQWITAFQLLFHVACPQSGETVLVHAASSGVGQAAIQLAKANGLTVISTCRSNDKVQCCIALGSDFAYNVKEEPNFSELVKNATGGLGVDIILDPVGASYVNENIDCCAMDAKWVLYGTMGGKSIHDDLFLSRLMGKRISILPTTLRSRSKQYKDKLIRHFESEVVPKIESGAYRINISSVHPMTTEGIQAAQRKMSNHENIGKIVISISTDS